MLLDIFSIFESSLRGIHRKNFLEDSAKRKADLKSFGTKLSKGISLSATEKERLAIRIQFLISFSNAPGYPKQEMARLIGELADHDIEVGNVSHGRGFDTRNTKYSQLSVNTQAN